jgi:hypothetical protein
MKNRTVKVVKKADLAKVEVVRQEAFERTDRQVERDAAEVVKGWVYATRARQLAEEHAAREFWKRH